MALRTTVRVELLATIHFKGKTWTPVIGAGRFARVLRMALSFQGVTRRNAKTSLVTNLGPRLLGVICILPLERALQICGPSPLLSPLRRAMRGGHIIEHMRAIL